MKNKIISEPRISVNPGKIIIYSSKGKKELPNVYLNYFGKYLLVFSDENSFKLFADGMIKLFSKLNKRNVTSILKREIFSSATGGSAYPTIEKKPGVYVYKTGRGEITLKENIENFTYTANNPQTLQKFGSKIMLLKDLSSDNSYDSNSINILKIMKYVIKMVENTETAQQ